MEIQNWVDPLVNDDWLVYVKRLSANDTGATGGHQVGVYIPKAVLSEVFPSLDVSLLPNPDVEFTAVVESDELPEQRLRAIYYNQKTRNEKRITRWKSGVSYTPIQDTEKTGAIALFAFRNRKPADCDYLKVWVCRSLEEESFIEEHLGEVDPQSDFFGTGAEVFRGVVRQKPESVLALPEEWRTVFPTGAQIVEYLLEKHVFSDESPDKRILSRRKEEYSLFMKVEEAHLLPLIKSGFSEVEKFVQLANSILNRRKSRSGRSLEIHLEKIFQEEGLLSFGTQCITEGNKRPDFLFPSCEAYRDNTYPDQNLRMLAVKTTVKDRWRQILNEASRIKQPYLFTLQQGVSVNQFKEMRESNVRLVVPESLHESFPKEIRGELMSLTGFIRESKAIYSAK